MKKMNFVYQVYVFFLDNTQTIDENGDMFVHSECVVQWCFASLIVMYLKIFHDKTIS